MHSSEASFVFFPVTQEALCLVSNTAPATFKYIETRFLRGMSRCLSASFSPPTPWSPLNPGELSRAWLFRQESLFCIANLAVTGPNALFKPFNSFLPRNRNPFHSFFKKISSMFLIHDVCIFFAFIESMK